MIWKPNLAIFYLWSTENCEFFTNIKKKGEKLQRNPDSWLLVKPESRMPLCQLPHDGSQPSGVGTIPGTPACCAQGCACYRAGLGHVTENIHFNRHHVPVIPIFQDPNSISKTDSSTPSSKKKKFFVRLCFLIHSLENTVTVIITQWCDDWTQLVWAAQGAESTSTPHLTHWFTQLFNSFA